MSRVALLLHVGLGVGLGLATGVARADEPTTPLASPTLEPLLRMALALAALGVAAWAVGAWARRRRISRTGTDCRIDVLALRSVGPRQRLALVEVAERRFLLGLGSDSVRCLADLSDAFPFDGHLERRLGDGGDGEGQEILGTIGRFEGLDG